MSRGALITIFKSALKEEMTKNNAVNSVLRTVEPLHNDYLETSNESGWCKEMTVMGR